MSEANVVTELESLLNDQPVNPLRPHQVQGYEEERVRLEAIVNAPPFVPGDRGNAITRLRQVRQTLDKQAPKPITDEYRRGQVYRKANEVLELIKSSMLPRNVMRRNPPGAVTTSLRRENAPLMKRAKLAWKRAMWALDPTTDNADHSNLELHRREGTVEDTATFMADAQIPGNFAMTPQAKANWPLGDATSKTAVSHLQKAEEPTPSEPSDSPDAVDTSVAIPQRLCECGCGKWFKPRSIVQRYVNFRHRNRNYKRATIRQETRIGRRHSADHVIRPADSAPEHDAGGDGGHGN